MIPLMLLFLSLFISGCGGNNPRSTVKDYVKAVLKDDSTAVDSLIDWETMITGRLQEMSPQDSLNALAYHKGNFLSSLVDSGWRRLYYMNSQIVIGKSDISGDRAEVELSFIDQQTRVQNYTRVVLIKKGKNWKIIYFN